MTDQSTLSPRVTHVEHSPMLHTYKVRKSWGWGSFYVRPFVSPEGNYFGVEVLVNSDYGVYGHCWPHIGPGGWRSFLAGLDREYAMRKLATREQYEKPLERDAFIKAMLDEIKAFEADAWDDLTETQRAHNAMMREVLADTYLFEDSNPVSYFKTFNDAAMGVPYAREMYDVRLWDVSPSVVGFWEHVWTPFAAHLRQELEQQAA